MLHPNKFIGIRAIAHFPKVDRAIVSTINNTAKKDRVVPFPYPKQSH
jgi:hypothetical protein